MLVWSLVLTLTKYFHNITWIEDMKHSKKMKYSKCSKNTLKFTKYGFNSEYWTRKYKWVKVFKNGLSKICERLPLKKLKRYDLLRSSFKENKVQ